MNDNQWFDSLDRIRALWPDDLTGASDHLARKGFPLITESHWFEGNHGKALDCIIQDAYSGKSAGRKLEQFLDELSEIGRHLLRWEGLTDALDAETQVKEERDRKLSRARSERADAIERITDGLDEETAKELGVKACCRPFDRSFYIEVDGNTLRGQLRSEAGGDYLLSWEEGEDAWTVKGGAFIPDHVTSGGGYSKIR